MKYFKKIMTTLSVVAISATIAILPASAIGFVYEKEAEALHILGLYKGIDLNTFLPELAAKMDRQTGVVMLLRLFGQEEEAKLLTDEKTNSILSKFKDANSIAAWSKQQVAYAVDKGYIRGYPEDSTFRPTDALNGKAYCSLILQQLGYDGDFQYDNAAFRLSDIGGLTTSEANNFNNDNALIKDSLVGISYGTLKAKYRANGEKHINALVRRGVVSVENVKEVGLYTPDMVFEQSQKENLQ